MRKIKMMLFFLVGSASTVFAGTAPLLVDFAPDSPVIRGVTVPVKVTYNGEETKAHVEIYSDPTGTPAMITMGDVDTPQPKTFGWTDKNTSYPILVLAKGGTCTLLSQASPDGDLSRQVNGESGVLSGTANANLPMSSNAYRAYLTLPTIEVKMTCEKAAYAK